MNEKVRVRVVKDERHANGVITNYRQERMPTHYLILGEVVN